MKFKKSKMIIIGLSIFVLLFFVVSCIANPVFVFKRKSDNIIVSKDNLYRDVLKLSTVSPPRYFVNSESLDIISEYIADEFRKLDCKVEFQYYADTKKKYRNVRAIFNPEKKQRIVVGAHYDSCGDMPGADDNASGTAGILEIARLFDKYKPVTDYCIEFVAYCTEEPPHFGTEYMGSAIHAKSLKTDSIDVKLMICLEMIGYFTDEPDSQDYPSNALKLFYPSTGDFILIVNKFGHNHSTRKIKRKMKQIGEVKVKSLNSPLTFAGYELGIDLSDHRNYWDLGYEAVMITNTAFYRNKNYHTHEDTIDRLDFDRFTATVKAVYTAITEY